MDNSISSIQDMMIRRKISVPSYQRAYSWDTEREDVKLTSLKQVNKFLSDIEDYLYSGNSLEEGKVSYYFGHFLFEKVAEKEFAIIDGQQRLTTIVIFACSVLKVLKEKFNIDTEQEDFLATVKECIEHRGYRFHTVEYDDDLFKDYIIDNKSVNTNNLEIKSQKRMVDAYEFFNNYLAGKDEEYLRNGIKIVMNARCTAHVVNDGAEATQMFIFQNNRGKEPTKLEIIKAQFMYAVHLYAQEEDKERFLKEINKRFSSVYKNIVLLEDYVQEDTILNLTVKVYDNTLDYKEALEWIDKQLANKENCIDFVSNFTFCIESNFNNLKTFYTKDRENSDIHSFISLGGNTDFLPFILKAYQFNLDTDIIAELCKQLEKLVLRDKLIGRRANLTLRINDIFKDFSTNNKDIKPIFETINYILNAPSDDWWYAYWNKENLEYALNNYVPNRELAKFLLWKYENYLRTEKEKKGYGYLRFDQIPDKQLEHIAPQTPTDGAPVATGYDEYDDEFKQNYIDNLGNYLLLSGSHNASIGNKPFKDKRETYTSLAQQREIQEMTKDNCHWGKKEIEQRREKIITFILENF